MSTLTIPNTFVNGGTIVAAEHNANFTAVKNFVDGLASGTNFAAGAINTEDIAASAITATKIATGAVTGAKIENSVTLTTPNIGAATGTSLTTTGMVIGRIAISPVVGAYTLSLSDEGKLNEFDNAGATNITVPPDSSANFPIGAQLILVQSGAGQITVVAGSGVTVNATPGLKLRAQWSSAVLIKRGANSWVLLGDLSS